MRFNYNTITINMITRWERGEIKNGRVAYIAPLRPPTVAAFRPWRGSAGAGRIRLCRHKDNKKEVFGKLFSGDPLMSDGAEGFIFLSGGLYFPVRLLNLAMPTNSSARAPGAR
jgi:hypothetical protein